MHGPHSQVLIYDFLLHFKSIYFKLLAENFEIFLHSVFLYQVPFLLEGSISTVCKNEVSKGW